ncbi:MAG: hypothetical protein ACLFWM_11090 [Actinomycetota bacterium]
MNRLLARLAWWTAVAALGELVFLRIATRTFVHIPGMDVLSGPLAALAETGRLAFYLAVVLLAALGVVLAAVVVRFRPSGAWPLAGALGLAALSSVTAGLGGIPPSLAGWLGLGAVGLAAGAAVPLGLKAIPLLMWAIALGLGATGILLQGPGGGLSGGEVGSLLLAGDVIAVVAASSLPLLLRGRPSRRAVVAGAITAAAVLGALAAASSTTAVLVLWSFGIPAGLAPLLYGVAAGAAVTTVWSALQTGDGLVAAGVILLGAGGFGLISTYQTTLVVAGLSLAVLGLRSGPATDGHQVAGVRPATPLPARLDPAGR